MKVIDSTFILGAPSENFFPKHALGEIAVLGRSNVGKSTFINKMLSRTKLAHVSSQPGKTREINFYKLTDDSKNELCLVDCPGFGYAKVSKKLRGTFSKVIVEYLESRENLKIALLLNDIRRDPQEDELAVRDMIFNLGVPLIIVLTKSDKLNQKEMHARSKELCKLYNLEPDDFIFSSTKLNTKNVWYRLMTIFAAGAARDQ